MKTIVCAMALAGLLVPLAGCETLTDTAPENQVRVEHAAIMDLRQVNNDLEYMFYLDRPVWLSRYPIPNE